MACDTLELYDGIMPDDPSQTPSQNKTNCMAFRDWEVNTFAQWLTTTAPLICDTEQLAKHIIDTSNYVGEFNPNYVGGYAEKDTVSVGEATYMSKKDNNTDDVSVLSSWLPINNNGWIIGANEDLNSYKTTGVYYQVSNSNAYGGSNYPVPYAGILSVNYVPSFIYQEYTVYNTGSTSTAGVKFKRQYYNNSWSPWQKIMSTDSIASEPVTTLTLANNNVNEYLYYKIASFSDMQKNDVFTIDFNCSIGYGGTAETGGGRIYLKCIYQDTAVNLNMELSGWTDVLGIQNIGLVKISETEHELYIRLAPYTKFHVSISESRKGSFSTHINSYALATTPTGFISKFDKMRRISFSSDKNQCTAWVNFDGTTGVIRDSYNIASVVRNNVGLYTINFLTQMNTNGYVVAGAAGGDSSAYNAGADVSLLDRTTGAVTTVDFAKIQVTYNYTSLIDYPIVTIVFFGGK